MEIAAPAVPSTVLVVDDDPLVANAIATLIEREGRTVIVCNDTASAELALHEFPFTHVISDLQLSKDVSFEGVRFVDAARRAQPGSRIIVVSGYASQIVRSAALASGADAFLAKPFDDAEISLALGDDPSDSDAPPGPVLEVRSVDALLAARAITSHFQPIVSLSTDTPQVHGFEALARIPSGWPFSDMKTLFEYASRKNRVFDVNRACVEAALSASGDLTDRGLLFINLDPVVLATAGFAKLLRGLASASNVPLSRLVIELTENAVSYDIGSALRAIAELRTEGVLFAIDDAESAPAHLPFIEKIKPAYLKVSSHLGAAFATDEKKAQIIRSIAGFAADLGSSLVLEGIETKEAAQRAKACGIPFGQGFYFSRAVEAASAAAYTP